MELELLHTGILSVNTFIVPLIKNVVFIVDPASSSLSYDEEKLVDYLEKKNLLPIGIFLTHGHFDHVMGIESLKNRWPEIKIAIHKEDSNCIGSNSKEIQSKFLFSMGPGAIELVNAMSSLPSADIILEDGMSFDKYIDSDFLNSFIKKYNLDISSELIFKELAKWKVIHTPGHTKGSVCFYNSSESKLISGDTIFYGTYGRTDLYGGSEKEIFTSIRNLLKSIPGDTLVYPGHDRIDFKLSTLESLF